MFKQAVEAALLQLPMVNGCCVVAHGEEGEDKYLAAYVVPEGKVTSVMKTSSLTHAFRSGHLC